MLAADLDADDNLDMSVASTTGFTLGMRIMVAVQKSGKADECRWPLRTCGDDLVGDRALDLSAPNVTVTPSPGAKI